MVLCIGNIFLALEIMAAVFNDIPSHIFNSIFIKASKYYRLPYAYISVHVGNLTSKNQSSVLDLDANYAMSI